MTRIVAPELRAFVARVLEGVGMRRTDAATVAEAMVWADLRGIEPHGVAKLRVCVERMRSGGSPPSAVPTSIGDSGVTALIDAQAAWGQLAACRAMALAVEKARRYRAGIVVVRNSSSLGALGYYPLLAVRHDFVGLAITNSMPLLAPWGGTTRLLGNQAYAIASPAGRHPPLLLDTSNSATSWGRVKLALEQREQLAPGLALDREGNPTVDPAAALQGLLLPAGGHKGYGLALMWEVLTGVLAGGAFGPNVGGLDALDCPQEVAHFLLALDPAAFLPLDQFKARVDSLIDQIHAVPPAPDVDRIHAPGQRSFLIAEERECEGIPLSDTRLRELRSLAAELGVAPPA